MNRQISRKNSSSKLPQTLTSAESPEASPSGCPFSGVLCKAVHSTNILEALWPQASGDASPFLTPSNSIAPLLPASLGPLVFPLHILSLAISSFLLASLCFPVWDYRENSALWECQMSCHCYFIHGVFRQFNSI